MPPTLPPPSEDEGYNSSSDSDFDALSPSSGDESDASTGAVATNGKWKKRTPDANGDLEMGSGDEGIIAQGRKNKRKKGKGNGKAQAKDAALENEEEEDVDQEVAVGIRVKLRSGRGGDEAAKTKIATSTSAVTIDIDSVWERMNDPQALQQPSTPSSKPSYSSTLSCVPAGKQAFKNLSPSIQTSAPTETITIPHTYIFAGETHTSTRTLPVNSPEALAYLASKKKARAVPQGPALRRPLARKGLLEPNPSALIKGLPSTPRTDLPTSIGGNGTKALAAGNKVSGREGGIREVKDVKLNTVEKSKLDWEQEVERQGLREELTKAEKSGTSYLGRMEFLGRTQEAREEEGRRWRMAGKT
ncbi:MAG: hypothetical protein Q9163_001140 [Psora crenata]